jgi:hypothetical protein
VGHPLPPRDNRYFTKLGFNPYVASPKEVGGDHVLETRYGEPEGAGSHEASNGPIREGLAFFEGSVGPHLESFKELREGELGPFGDVFESVVPDDHLHPVSGRI